MTSLLEWLLDLDSIRLGEGANLSLQWESAWPRWVVIGGILAMLGYVFLVYRREGGPSRGRVLLGGMRAVLLLLVLGLLCQPVLVLKRNRTERATVAVLLDASASMNRRDRYTEPQADSLRGFLDGGAGSPVSTSPASGPAVLSEQTRLSLTQRALMRETGRVFDTLAVNNAVEIYRYSDSVSLSLLAKVDAAGSVEAALDAVARVTPNGPGTDLASALRTTFAETQGRRVAGILLVTDGRNTQPIDLQPIIEAARKREIPLHTVKVGSPIPPRDIVVGPIRSEESVYVKDLLSIRALVAAEGYPEPITVSVQLREDGLDRLITEETVTLRPNERTEVELRTKAATPGRRRYRVEVAPLPEEAETANNVDRVEINVIDTKVRLLYVEGYPRFEYRYLKNMLLREETITASCLLLSADEQFAQEGDEPIRRFPETPEELNRYDVVLFGDVDARGDWITEAQRTMLLDFVGNRGGGFGVIAGERNAPHRFRGTVLEKLLPVTIDVNFTGRYDETLTGSFPVNLTLEGRNSPIFRFETDPRENLRTLASLPGLYWLCRVQAAKPGAEVLAENPAIQTMHGPMPVVVVGRYGTGKVLFQGTDDTWRWRRYVGEPFFDAYWLQIARYLAPSKLTGGHRKFRLDTDRREYDFGDPVSIQLTVLDTQLLPTLPETIACKILDRDGLVVRMVPLHRVGRNARWYEGSFVPPGDGSFSAATEVSSTALDAQPPTTLFRVSRAELESRVVHADHDLLERLSANTGGESVFLPEMAQLAERIPDRSIRFPDDLAEPLWDTRLILALFVLIIATEWSLRKLFGMI